MFDFSFVDMDRFLFVYLFPCLLLIPLVLFVSYFCRNTQDPDEENGQGSDAYNSYGSSNKTNEKTSPVNSYRTRGESIPAQSYRDSPATIAETYSRKLFSRKRLLVVDDSAVVRKKLEGLLHPSYSLLFATNGLEALQVLEKEPVSLVITDLHMPVMDGFKLISSIHGSIKTENLPIIAITAHEELTARVHQLQGVYGIFTKPWNDRELLKRIEALTNIKS